MLAWSLYPLATVVRQGGGRLRYHPTSVRHNVNDSCFTTIFEKIKPESNAYGVSVVICVSIAICVSVSAGLRLFHGRFVSILLSVCVQARLIVGGSMPT